MRAKRGRGGAVLTKTLIIMPPPFCFNEFTPANTQRSLQKNGGTFNTGVANGCLMLYALPYLGMALLWLLLRRVILLLLSRARVACSSIERLLGASSRSRRLFFGRLAQQEIYWYRCSSTRQPSGHDRWQKQKEVKKAASARRYPRVRLWLWATSVSAGRCGVWLVERTQPWAPRKTGTRVYI